MNAFLDAWLAIRRVYITPIIKCLYIIGKRCIGLIDRSKSAIREAWMKL